MLCLNTPVSKPKGDSGKEKLPYIVGWNILEQKVEHNQQSGKGRNLGRNQTQPGQAILFWLAHIKVTIHRPNIIQAIHSILLLWRCIQ